MTLINLFFRFLILGCMSFGGPIAHLGYFHREFVIRLNWLSEKQYSQFVALSQILPGPGSSQVGFCIGLNRAGLLGGVCAFLGFTAPSFIVMYCFAMLLADSSSNVLIQAIISALKLVAAIVVADAIISMFKSFCQDRTSMLVALIACALLALYPHPVLQLSLLALCAVGGANFYQRKNTAKCMPVKPRLLKITKRLSLIPLSIFIALLAASTLTRKLSPELEVFDAFYRAGSLVFGGGHVVLPMLQHDLDGLISKNDFLAGYGAAQVVPGPMFTLATFFGALSLDSPLLGAALATLAIFLPGFLLVLTFKDGWEKLLNLPSLAGAMWAINAYVVGLLGATFINPLAFNTLNNLPAVFLTIAGVFALRVLKLPVILMILVCLVFGIIGVV